MHSSGILIITKGETHLILPVRQNQHLFIAGCRGIKYPAHQAICCITHHWYLLNIRLYLHPPPSTLLSVSIRTKTLLVKESVMDGMHSSSRLIITKGVTHLILPVRKNQPASIYSRLKRNQISCPSSYLPAPRLLFYQISEDMGLKSIPLSRHQWKCTQQCLGDGKTAFLKTMLRWGALSLTSGTTVSLLVTCFLHIKTSCLTLLLVRQHLITIAA